MRTLATKLKDLFLVEPEIHRDPRGFFAESFRAERFRELGLPDVFVQDNHVHSVQGILRGLHAQIRHPQGKLVRVSVGEIFDVAVDLRSGSPTYGRWDGHRLSGENGLQLYIPPGFLHGYCVLSPSAEVAYKCTDYYRSGDEVGVIWNDPTLGIEWPLTDPVLSAKDAGLPDLRTVEKRLAGGMGGGNG